MKKFLAFFVSFAALSACAPEPHPPVSFVPPSSDRIFLNVASIDVVDHSQFQPSDSPYYKEHFTPTIAEVVRQWVKNTLTASGASGQATVIIEDASLSERALATSDALSDQMFKRQQASRYTGHLKVHMELHQGESYGFADAETTHNITLPEEPTPGERKDSYTQLLNDLSRDFSTNFSHSIHDHAAWAVKGG